MMSTKPSQRGLKWQNTSWFLRSLLVSFEAENDIRKTHQLSGHSTFLEQTATTLPEDFGHGYHSCNRPIIFVSGTSSWNAETAEKKIGRQAGARVTNILWDAVVPWGCLTKILNAKKASLVCETCIGTEMRSFANSQNVQSAHCCRDENVPLLLCRHGALCDLMRSFPRISRRLLQLSTNGNDPVQIELFLSFPKLYRLVFEWYLLAGPTFEWEAGERA